MVWFAWIVWIIMTGLFIGVMKKEPRTLWSGLSCFFMILTLGIALMLTGFQYSAWIQTYPTLYWIIMVLLTAIVFILLFFPFIVMVTFFIEGIQLIRKEGLRFSNLLSLLFSFGLLLYLVGFPILKGFDQNPYLNILYGLIASLVFFSGAQFSIFTLSALLNLIHFKKKNQFDIILVLGSGIDKEEVSPLLASRIDKGLELLKYNPEATLIVSGGQGAGEDIPESLAMFRYCVERGIDPKQIIMENESKNTEQNLRYSQALFPPNKSRLAIVTTRYHIFRALEIARTRQIPCKGFGSKTKWYFTLNAFLREYVGYLKLSWKIQWRWIALIALPWLILLFFVHSM